MATGGKPKNDGQVLTVRISNAAHAALNHILAFYALKGYTAGKRSKGVAVEDALMAWSTYIEQERKDIYPEGPDAGYAALIAKIEGPK